MRFPSTVVAVGLVGLVGACTGVVGGGSGGDDDDTADAASGGADADSGAPGVDGAGPGGPDPSEELYAQDRVPRFDIELSADSRAALESDGTQYVPCTFRYGDETLENVGIRIKGEANRVPFDQKAAFKLKFDELVPDQRFRGLTRMTLNGGREDPSFIAERLVYLAYREAGVAAPRANNALVYIDGEFRGVYVNVETEDKTFLARWFGSNAGNLYEEGGADWYPGNEDAFELETNETANDRSRLRALFEAADAAQPDTLEADMAALLDVDVWLHQAALEGLVSQWDGYAYTMFGPNNYRIYDDVSTGHFHVLPWGMDMALKPYGDADTVDLSSASGMLFQKCLAGTTCRARFAQIVDEELARWASGDLAGRGAAMRAQIRDAVGTDGYSGISTEDFDNWTGVVIEQITNRAATAADDL